MDGSDVFTLVSYLIFSPSCHLTDYHHHRLPSPSPSLLPHHQARVQLLVVNAHLAFFSHLCQLTNITTSGPAVTASCDRFTDRETTSSMKKKSKLNIFATIRAFFFLFSFSSVSHHESRCRTSKSSTASAPKNPALLPGCSSKVSFGRECCHPHIRNVITPNIRNIVTTNIRNIVTTNTPYTERRHPQYTVMVQTSATSTNAAPDATSNATYYVVLREQKFIYYWCLCISWLFKKAIHPLQISPIISNGLTRCKCLLSTSRCTNLIPDCPCLHVNPLSHLCQLTNITTTGPAMTASCKHSTDYKITSTCLWGRFFFCLFTTLPSMFKLHIMTKPPRVHEKKNQKFIIFAASRAFFSFIFSSLASHILLQNKQIFNRIGCILTCSPISFSSSQCTRPGYTTHQRCPRAPKNSIKRLSSSSFFNSLFFTYFSHFLNASTGSSCSTVTLDQ